MTKQTFITHINIFFAFLEKKFKCIYWQEEWIYEENDRQQINEPSLQCYFLSAKTFVYNYQGYNVIKLLARTSTQVLLELIIWKNNWIKTRLPFYYSTNDWDMFG